MLNRKIVLSLFVLVALIQLYVPASMILETEEVATEGRQYKFRTAPVDPTDPFRGKYITLDFEENTYDVPRSTEWKTGQDVYVSLEKDENGFASVSSVYREEPLDIREDYVKAELRYIVPKDSVTSTLQIIYPFRRFYMEESKAFEAELAYRETQRDTTKETYAVVLVLEGKARLTDVMIDGVSIREVVEQRMEETRRNGAIEMKSI